MNRTDDLRVDNIIPLATPNEVLKDIPLSDLQAQDITGYRKQIKDIIHTRSDKLLVIVGPCSIHDIDAAIEYARKLKELSLQYNDNLCIVMRVYFEKPRTTVGWKGLINDPDLDGSCQINSGLHIARKLLLDITEIGLPCATEFLDNLIPQYLSDVISWAAIGARTTESQIHRQLVSGLSMPVGYKNGTNGDIKIAIQAMLSSSQPHNFTGITKEGQIALIQTKGNTDTHVILRGSHSGPNYDRKIVAKSSDELVEANAHSSAIMVDCSHGNSCKDYRKQVDVVEDVCDQLQSGSKIMGVMLESNINEGAQKLADGKNLEYGVSVTDSCLSLEQTVPLLEKLSHAVSLNRSKAHA
jgi:3-deoxy-7-phosphoheptulonate synthase